MHARPAKGGRIARDLPKLNPPRRDPRRPRQTFSDCTVSGTSWTRSSCAPCSAALSAMARLPGRRSDAGNLAGQGTNEALATGADKEWAAEAVEEREAVEQREVLGQPFAEADAGIDDQAAARDAFALPARRCARRANRTRRSERCRSCRPRGASRAASGECMMTMGSARSRSRSMRFAIEAQCRDIVDDSRTGGERRFHYAGLARVDRDSGAALRQSGDDGLSAGNLVAFPNRVGIGPRRFAADIDQCRARAAAMAWPWAVALGWSV